MSIYLNICKAILIFFLSFNKKSFDDRENKKSFGDIEIVSKHGEKIIIIDSSLKLNSWNNMSDPKPARMLLHEYAKTAENHPETEDDRKHAKNKIPVLGPRKNVSSNGNYGFFFICACKLQQSLDT